MNKMHTRVSRVSQLRQDIAVEYENRDKGFICPKGMPEAGIVAQAQITPEPKDIDQGFQQTD